MDQMLVRSAVLDPLTTYTAAHATAQGVPANYGRNRRQLDITAIEAMEKVATNTRSAYSSSQMAVVSLKSSNA